MWIHAFIQDLGAYKHKFARIVSWHIKKISEKILKTTIYRLCNFSSSGDIVYKECWHWNKLVTDLFYDFVSILLVWVAKFKMPSNWKNISSLITLPSNYQCIRRKTRLVSKLVHIVIHCRHISMTMECMIPKCKFSKQMIKKYLVTEYLFITEGEFVF